MSLLGDGKSAVAAIVSNPALFPRLKAADWSIAAVRLAKKQIVSAGLDAGDILEIRKTIGPDTFEKTLQDLTAYQAKLLARRINPALDPEAVASKSMALSEIKATLEKGAPETASKPADAPSTGEADTGDLATADPEPRSNPYIGRKAFRVR